MKSTTHGSKSAGLFFFCLLFLFQARADYQVKPIVLSTEQANLLGEKVWQNEGAGQLKYLLHWNDGEDFMSLGIGHFIWFAEGHSEIFEEAFPRVLKFYEANNVAMPSWLNSATPCPWRSKEAFYAAKKARTPRYVALENFMDSTRPVQARFLAQRLDRAMPRILAELSNGDEQALVVANFNKVLYQDGGEINPQGLYILLDYLNFKGEGIVEKYHGQGWGLLQVLKNMDSNNHVAVNAFADSAKQMLGRRVGNSPPARNEKRWLEGWFIRLESYYEDGFGEAP